MEVSILVRCYEYNGYTKNAIDSIMRTATTDYNLMIAPRKLHAAQNSNLLIDKAPSEYIILMDDDLTFPEVGWDSKLIETLLKYDDVGCVASQLMDEAGSLIGPKPLPELNKVLVGAEAWGACLAFRDVGIRYDENYIKTICDDTDFLYQWLDNDYKIATDTRALVKHMKPCSRASNPPWFKQNYEYFKKKWAPNGKFPSWGTREYRV